MGQQSYSNKQQNKKDDTQPIVYANQPIVYTTQPIHNKFFII